MGLQDIRINYFGSSLFWIAWCWIKAEWLLEKTNQRIWFLQECKRNRVIPKFISNKIQTTGFFHEDDQRAAKARHRYALEVMNTVIKREFQERRSVQKKAIQSRESMFGYSKEQYLFTRDLKDRMIEKERRRSQRRLTWKLMSLIRYGRRMIVVEDRTCSERVTCIDYAVTEAERPLLQKGPKFVPTKGKLTENERRDLESEIETTACDLRRRLKKDGETRRNSNGEKNSGESGDEVGPGMTLLLDPKLGRLRSHGRCVKQPEKVDFEVESKISHLKMGILEAYTNYRPTHRNVTKKETEAMTALKARDLVIKCSDKSKSLVVMSDEVYRQKVMEILDNTDNYEKSDVTAEVLEERVATELKKIKALKQNLPRDIYTGLVPKDTRLPEFYGLPKIHKIGTPLRPVVAAFGGPVSGISILLERILNQLLPYVPAHIGNTLAATQSLKKAFPDLRAPENTIIVTLDVVALYPSIPIADGIAAVMKKLDDHTDEIDLLGLSANDMEHLLYFVLENNYFKFNNTVFRQRRGVAMGNHLAPPFAIIFMDQLEQRMLRTAIRQPEFFVRYVDDCLMAWLHGEEELERFLSHCNEQHPNIRFTWETSCKTPVSFMDMSISIGTGGIIEYQLYQKPADSGVSLNYLSAIPMSVKMGVATQQFRRALALSSDCEMEKKSEKKIVTLLKENGYPDEDIRKALKRSKRMSPRGRKERTDAAILKLPFRSDALHKRILNLCKESRLPVEVVYEQGANLKRILTRSPYSKPECAVHRKYVEQQGLNKRPRGKPRDDCITCQCGINSEKCDERGVVYLLKCEICGDEYVGESARTVRARVGEHHFQARNRRKETAWGEHMCNHPDIKVNKTPIFSGSILATVKGETKRKVREAIEIRRRNPRINRSKGWNLS